MGLFELSIFHDSGKDSVTVGSASSCKNLEPQDFKIKDK